MESLEACRSLAGRGTMHAACEAQPPPVSPPAPPAQASGCALAPGTRCEGIVALLGLYLARLAARRRRGTPVRAAAG